jgi:hypothetical protein
MDEQERHPSAEGAANPPADDTAYQPSGAYGPGYQRPEHPAYPTTGIPYATGSPYATGNPYPAGGGAAYPPGGPVDERPRASWTGRRIAVTAVAVVAIAAVGGVAVAATHSSSGGQGGTTGPGGAGGQGGAGGTGQGGGPGGMGGIGATGLGAALHGQFVVKDTSTGAYVTRLLQAGTVTAISSTSITITSADNYVGTYTLSSSTTVDNGDAAIGSVVKGHPVTLISSADKAALTLTDQNLFSRSGTRNGGGPPAGAPGN